MFLNLRNPRTYNEKINFIKLYKRDSIYADLSDKYFVREYVKEILGEKYLIPCIAVYERIDDIEWNLLPDRCVIKVSNGSGTNIIYNNMTCDVDKSKRLLKKWMRRDGSLFGREWVYAVHKPKIIVEKYLMNSDGSSIQDFKFMCFDGKVEYIQLHTNRFKESYTNDFYTREWLKTDISQGVANSKDIYEKPDLLDKAISVAERLAKGFNYVRVDLYLVGKLIFFGEMTFFPTSGFCNFNKMEYDFELGKKIKL